MFLIFGIGEKEKELKSFEQIVCPLCGRYTRAVLILRYTYLHLFFIPTFRWNRRWLIKLRCCCALYEADREYGRELEVSDRIDFSRLHCVSSGFGAFHGSESPDIRCSRCGRSYDSSFAFCPHCGTPKP